MARVVSQDSPTEKRVEGRHTPEGFHGASIKLVGVPLYQFKLKDMSDNGSSILVKDDSFMINYLKVGKTLQINFTSDHRSDHNGVFESKIVHITKVDTGRYKGHYLVGVRILSK
jgi:hypothetical protein